MALRHSFAAVVAPFLLVACGDTASPPASSAGASPGGVSSSSSGSGGAGASGSGGGAGASVGGTIAGGGVSDYAGAGESTSGGRGGSPASDGASGGGGAGFSAGGVAAGSTSVDESGGQTSGIPGGWIPVTDVDYSKVPGPNFDTVRLMFEASPCSGSSCHYGGRNHLQVGKPADQLYSYMMSFKTLQCGKLIDTANPSQSALVKYLRGPCGMIERMPSGKCFDDGDPQCLPEYYIQAIEQWIANGAPR